MTKLFEPTVKGKRIFYTLLETELEKPVYIRVMTQCQDEFRILSGRTQKVAKWCWKQWNEHNLMYIYHKQYENMQKFNERAQTAKLSVFTRGRQELCAENPKKQGKQEKLKRELIKISQ